MQDLDNLPHAQRERLAFIDFSLQYFGHIARTELIQRFQTGLAACTRDFTLYKEYAPDNLILRHEDKRYHRKATFKALFPHDPEVILYSLSRGFGDGLSSPVQPSHQCIDAVGLIHPNADIIAALMRAIHQQKVIECDYVSASSGKGQRLLIPHALVNNGHRWHVRAYDRKYQSFRDYVCSRFTRITHTDDAITDDERSSADEQFNQRVTLKLIPHPSLAQPRAIELDYGMVDGHYSLRVRAAQAAYILRQWQVDCSSGYRFSGQGCQLALANLDVLGSIDNPSLAPGYSK
ncbi:helix-turn-helix transcriptional regulator [Alteromonas oceanisediminis]|uniref:helix-turn-helix transcriptional regulator n=1 Tax=Alteromonas oceanisediminis TaxID=2836180 RepID=UPI001BDA2874|nr:WYL domain-containing protein [Alteromonas oceanisediminis]MBT0585129.1 WYL domain-containing protein [Alteromonas oceanisediminis]